MGVLHAPQTDTKKIVVVAHGFTSSKDRERYVKLANALVKHTIALLRFDFGGCGESESREITISAQVDDLRSVIAYVQNAGYTHVGVLGESLGALTALKSFSEDLRALVLWSPTTKPFDFGDFPDEVLAGLEMKGSYIKTRIDGSSYVIPEKYYEELCGFSQKEVLENITIPVLIIHGEADDKESIENSEEAMTLLPRGSRLERIQNQEGSTHVFFEKDMEKVEPETVEWFESHL